MATFYSCCKHLVGCALGDCILDKSLHIAQFNRMMKDIFVVIYSFHVSLNLGIYQSILYHESLTLVKDLRLL